MGWYFEKLAATWLREKSKLQLFDYFDCDDNVDDNNEDEEYDVYAGFRLVL
jgi:hypothetical protein